MATYAKMAVTPVELGSIRSGDAGLRGVGCLTWTTLKPRCHQGVIAVTSDIARLSEGLLRIYYVDAAPSEPKLQLVIRNVPVHRACINGRHDGWEVVTHVHEYEPRSGTEWAYRMPQLVDLKLGPTVPPGSYRRAFEAFARLLSVELPSAYWSDPGGRR